MDCGRPRGHNNLWVDTEKAHIAVTNGPPSIGRMAPKDLRACENSAAWTGPPVPWNPAYGNGRKDEVRTTDIRADMVASLADQLWSFVTR